jgi:hypothetical protein
MPVDNDCIVLYTNVISSRYLSQSYGDLWTLVMGPPSQSTPSGWRESAEVPLLLDIDGILPHARLVIVPSQTVDRLDCSEVARGQDIVSLVQHLRSFVIWRSNRDKRSLRYKPQNRLLVPFPDFTFRFPNNTQAPRIKLTWSSSVTWNNRNSPLRIIRLSFGRN